MFSKTLSFHQIMYISGHIQYEEEEGGATIGNYSNIENLNQNRNDHLIFPHTEFRKITGFHVCKNTFIVQCHLFQ